MNDEDEDDDMAARSQDPGYALYMLKLEIEHVGEMMQKEHSESLKQGGLEDYLAKLALEEEFRKERAYWEDWNDLHGESDDEE